MVLYKYLFRFGTGSAYSAIQVSNQAGDSKYYITPPFRKTLSSVLLALEKGILEVCGCSSPHWVVAVTDGFIYQIKTL